MHAPRSHRSARGTKVSADGFALWEASRPHQQPDGSQHRSSELLRCTDATSNLFSVGLLATANCSDDTLTRISLNTAIVSVDALLEHTPRGAVVDFRQRPVHLSQAQTAHAARHLHAFLCSNDRCGTRDLLLIHLIVRLAVRPLPERFHELRSRHRHDSPLCNVECCRTR